MLKTAFDITPNSSFKFVFQNESETEREEQWDAYTDAYNNKYLYCKETESTAYYINDNTMFYFTAFYGDKNSLLYYFYLSAYKVFLGNADNLELTEAMPLNIIHNKKISVWLHDFIAPFFTYIRVTYSINGASADNLFETDQMTLKSEIKSSVFKNIRTESNSTITLNDNSIAAFTYTSMKTKIKATCLNI